MWDDPSLQVRLVSFRGGIAAPRIVVGEFALNKVIAQLRYGHWERTSLQRIWANFSHQSRDCFAGRIRIGILVHCADYPLTVDAFSVRSSGRPTKLPNIRAAFPVTLD